MPTDLPPHSTPVSARSVANRMSDRIIGWIAVAISVVLIGLGLCASVIGLSVLALN